MKTTLALVFALFGFAAAQAQTLLTFEGDVNSNSAKTRFDVVPSNTGEIDFIAIPENPRMTLDVQTVAPMVFQARLDWVDADHFAEFLLDGNTQTIALLNASSAAVAQRAFGYSFPAPYNDPDWWTFGGNNVIVIIDSGGTTHIPTDGPGFITTCQGIQNANLTITKLIIKGHGTEDPPTIELGPDHILTCGDFGDPIEVAPVDPTGGQPTDVTDVLREITNGNTHISLRGCHSHALAVTVESALSEHPGTNDPRVTGSCFYVLGIPGIRWVIGEMIDGHDRHWPHEFEND